jgi:hypothetical protein
VRRLVDGLRSLVQEKGTRQLTRASATEVSLRDAVELMFRDTPDHAVAVAEVEAMLSAWEGARNATGTKMQLWTDQAWALAPATWESPVAMFLPSHVKDYVMAHDDDGEDGAAEAEKATRMLLLNRLYPQEGVRNAPEPPSAGVQADEVRSPGMHAVFMLRHAMLAHNSVVDDTVRAAGLRAGRWMRRRMTPSLARASSLLDPTTIPDF